MGWLCWLTLLAACGSGEEDTGAKPRSDAGVEPRCGDGVQDPGELCDDGNDAEGDECAPDCRSRCGDHVVQGPREQCDFGPSSVPGCADCRALPLWECASDPAGCELVAPESGLPARKSTGSLTPEEFLAYCTWAKARWPGQVVCGNQRRYIVDCTPENMNFSSACITNVAQAESCLKQFMSCGGCTEDVCGLEPLAPAGAFCLRDDWCASGHCCRPGREAGTCTDRSECPRPNGAVCSSNDQCESAVCRDGSCHDVCTGIECGPSPLTGRQCGTCAEGKVCSKAGACCASRASRTCGADGHIYWHDGCGNAETVATECATPRYTCVEAECRCAPPRTGASCETCKLFVDAARGDDANAGAAWSSAKKTLSAALLLSQRVGGCEVWVARGTYTPAGSGAAATFAMHAGLKLYGGFAGTETALAQRNVQLNPTILSGDLGVLGNGDDNAHHVVTGADATVLDGFTVRDGNAAVYQGQGGGMIITAGAPRIENCIFESNEAQHGGALHSSEASPIVVSSVFRDNRARVPQNFAFSFASGGAVYVAGGRPHFYGCRFEGNHVNGGLQGRGGALYLGTARALVVGSVFYGNSASVTSASSTPRQSQGGGAFVFASDEAVFSNCTFYANRADVGSAFITDFGSATVQNSIFWGHGASAVAADPGVSFVLRVTNSDVQGGFVGSGNIDADPRFVAPLGGNFALSAGSPCINTGSSALVAPDAADLDGDGNVTEPVPVDGAGRARVSGLAVDMGAFEAN